ncbi:hypothetical protein I4300191C4_07450 [Solibaculum mannosilyticum]
MRSPPSRDGDFLTMDGDFFLHLADVGLKMAERTYEKHHFFRVGYKITQPEEA